MTKESPNWLAGARGVLMEDNLIQNNLKVKFVDEVNLMVESVGMGTRWTLGTLRWTQEWEDADLDRGRSHGQHHHPGSCRHGQLS